MRIQPINANAGSTNYGRMNTSFKSHYPNLSNRILTANRQKVLEMAEYLHKSSDVELRNYTRSNKKAYEIIKEAVDAVNIRKKCYVADGAFQHKVQELENKALERDFYLTAQGMKKKF